MDTVNCSDIKYNFLVDIDGRVYEGREYSVGEHTENYNNCSICIAFIGNFQSYEAPVKQLKAAERLIIDGVKNNKIHPEYFLYGHRQVKKTDSPGIMLYKQIVLWPHWKEIDPSQENDVQRHFCF